MINSVIVTNYLGDSIRLDLRNPEETGLAIKSITGLGPAKANINVTEITTNDGGLFNSARVESRNIVFNFSFLWNPTIEDTRHLTYKYFPIKKSVTLLFETDKRTASIMGYVESNETDIFSANEGCQISIICPDPFFYSPGDGKEAFASVESLFEFPFENQSRTEELIEFGNIEFITEQVITYDGDADTGVIIQINAVGVASGIQIFDRTTQESMSIDDSKLVALTGSGIVKGDRITINTNKGKKSITLLRDGHETNILNCLDRNSVWFQLSKGDNIISFTADSGGEKLEFRINYNILFEGV